MSGLNWPALMRAGISEAGLRPAEFWALTPAELMLVLGLDGSEQPLTRARLAELEARYATPKGD